MFRTLFFYFYLVKKRTLFFDRFGSKEDIFFGQLLKIKKKIMEQINYKDAVMYLKQTLNKPEIVTVMPITEQRKIMLPGEITSQQRYYVEVRLCLRYSIYDVKKIVYEKIFELDGLSLKEKENLVWKRIFEDLLLLYPYIDDEMILSTINSKNHH